MNTKRFRKICKISSYALIFFSAVLIFFVIYGIYSYFLGVGNMSFSYSSPDITLYSMGGSKGAIGITETERESAALAMLPITQFITIFVLLKGAAAFKWLGDGKRPFDLKFVNIIKRISLVLMLSDIIFPIVHSIILATISVDGYNFNFGFGTPFIIGVILYIVSEVFNYGIELQTLSDDVV